MGDTKLPAMDGRPALDAVIFDAGGTLVRLDFEWMVEALGRVGLVTDTAALRRAEVEGRRRYDRSRGVPAGEGEPLGSVGDVRAYFGGMLEAAGMPPDQIAALVTLFLEREKERGLWARPMEGAREALDAVEALGLRRAVVSNSDGRAEWHLRNAGVREGVELVVDSHRVGIEKPDPRIFGIALAGLGVSARRALYVGDILSVDESGARAAGLRFVLLDPWGDYAAPGVAAIASVRDLSGWIARTFTVPRLATGEGS